MNYKKNISLHLCWILAACILIASCKKDKFINPYDDPSLQAPATNPDASNLDPGNFAYLHAKIFKPTCANSGCHDGTFPPEFRTINSAYNTMVYQKPINTSNGTFRYRVYPYKADSSILFHRLNTPMGAGLMPLVIDPQSDWTGRKDEYILNIKNWINAGAKDMFGNYPNSGNKQPQVTGFLAFPSGNTSSPYSRASGYIVPIEVPAGSTIDLWFALDDDSTAASGFVSTTCKIATSLDGFNSASTVNMTYSSGGLTANDFTGSPVQFTHKATFNPSGYTAGTYLYIRTFIDDGSQGAPTEIPNSGTNDIMSGYFALKIL